MLPCAYHACTAANVAKGTGISALSGSVRAQGTAAQQQQQQQGLGLLPLRLAQGLSVSRVQRCGCPIQQHASGPTSLLSVREPRSACRNGFKDIAKRGTTVCEFQRLRLCWSHVCLAVTTAETRARLHACKLVRLPKEDREKRLLYKKLYSSGFRARAPSPKREMVMLG